MIKHNKCKICNGTDFFQFYKNKSVPLAGILLFDDETTDSVYTTDVYVCKECGHVQLLDTIADEVYKNYLYTPSNSRGFNEYVTELSDNLIKTFGTGKVIEIGSSNGIFLELMKNKGCDVIGYEPSTHLSEISKSKNIETRTEFFSEENINMSETADFVIIRHVLEHIDDLHDLMKGVSKAIKNDGVFIIEVPYLLNIIKENQFYAFFNEHVSYFSITSIKNLLAQYGFNIIDITNVYIEGGSICVYASKCTKESDKYEEYKNLHHFLEMECNNLSIANLMQFAANSNKKINEIRNFIQKYNRVGKSVAIWGAGQRSVTLLNICDLDNSHIKYVIDVNPDYQNKILPGCNLPVMHPNILNTDPVDVVIILATGYASQIIEDNKEFQKNGGVFVTIIPEIKEHK